MRLLKPFNYNQRYGWQLGILSIIFFILFSMGCGPADMSKPDDNLSTGIVTDDKRGLPLSPVKSLVNVPLPSVPTSVVINPINGTDDVSITWDEVTNAQSYRVYVSVVSTDAPVEWVKYPVDNSPFEMIDVVNSDVLDIDVVVSAVNLAGEGESSLPVALNATKAPTMPKSLISTKVLNSPLLSMNPIDGEVGVALDINPGVDYTVNDNIQFAYLRLIGSAPVFGKHTTSAGTIGFIPDAPLDADTTYTAAATFFYTETNGGTVRSEYEWTFSTAAPVGQLPNAGALLWQGADPGIGSDNVPISQEIKISFSNPIDLASVKNHTGIRIHGPTGATVDGAWRSEGLDIIFKPAQLLVPNQAQYVIFLSPGVRDIFGNQLSTDTYWVFHTAAGGVVTPDDTTPPEFSGVSPTVGERNVAVDKTIKFTFSEPIALASVQDPSQGISIHGPTGDFLAGAWKAKGNDLTFTPASPLQSGGAQYWVFLKTDLTDEAGNPFGQAFNWGFYTVDTPADITAPVLSGVSPTVGEKNVSINTKISIRFSESVALSSIQEPSEGVSIHGPTGGFLAGAWETNGNDIVFTPANTLQGGSQYWIFLKADLTDLAGNRYGQTFDWGFYTQGVALPTPTVTPPPLPGDITPPGLQGLSPGMGSPGAPEIVPVTAQIRLTFSEPMLLASVTNGGVTVMGPTSGSTFAALPGTWTAEGNDIVFTPTPPMQPDSQHIYTLNPANGPQLTDLAGNLFVGTASIVFRTEPAPVLTDTTPPNLAGLSPGIGDTNVPVTLKIRISFDEPILLSSLTSGGATVHGVDGGILPGVWTTEGNDSVFTPAVPLQGGNAQHIYFFKTGITDLAGNNFVPPPTNFVVFFTQ